MFHELRTIMFRIVKYALFVLSACGYAQSTGSYSPASNSIQTPGPFDPASNTTNPSALAVQSQNPYLGSVPTDPLVPGVLSLSLDEAVDCPMFCTSEELV